MLRRLFVLFIFVAFCTPAFAIDKVAFVDLNKVVNKSAQVQELRKEQNAKKQELANFIKKAGEDIKAQTDNNKKKDLIKKYEKELNAKREANMKDYTTKLEAIDKSISNTISTKAKEMGYDLVLTKGSVLYGGDDITESVIKAVK